MSKSVITDSLLTAIANAIRAKTGSAATMTPADMATAIGNIPSGSGATEPYVEYEINRIGSSVGDTYTSATLHGYTVIPMYAFCSCYATSYNFVNCAITKVHQHAFEKSKLNSLSAFSAVTRIEDGAFADCALLNGTLPAGLTYLGEKAFANCVALSASSIPTGLTSIPKQAFGACKALAITSIPSGVTSLGYESFTSCLALRTLTIPASVTSIGQSCFYGAGLTTLIIMGGPTIATGAVQRCTSLAEVRIVGQPSSIATNAFQYDTALTDICVSWAEGAVSGAPWGATNATIHYNTTFDAAGNVV